MIDRVFRFNKLISTRSALLEACTAYRGFVLHAAVNILCVVDTSWNSATRYRPQCVVNSRVLTKDLWFLITF